MVARALWRSEALRFVPWLRPCTRLRHMQGLRPRHNPASPDLHNAWATILNPFNTIWQHWSGSTLTEITACCLKAPSHYLNQCWFVIVGVLWHSLESNFIVNAQATIWNNEFVNNVVPDCYFFQGLMSHCIGHQFPTLFWFVTHHCSWFKRCWSI